MGSERTDVDARTAVGEEGPRRVWQQVAAANLDRIELEGLSHAIHHALDSEMRLRLPEAAVRTDRARRGRDARERPAVLRHRVRAAQCAHRHERGPDAGEVEDGIADVADDIDVQ